MLAYAFFVTFLLGLVMGGVGICALAIYMEERTMRARRKVHPSTRTEAPSFVKGAWN